MYRSRKTNNSYKPDERRVITKKKKDCPFCELGEREIVEQTATAYVLTNSFAYQYWEFMDVEEHLMIVPKKHVVSFSGLSSKEKAGIMDLISKYESQGYNIYAREKGNAVKSVEHQHTHLIKTKNRRAKFAIYLNKPYLVIKK